MNFNSPLEDLEEKYKHIEMSEKLFQQQYMCLTEAQEDELDETLSKIFQTKITRDKSPKKQTKVNVGTIGCPTLPELNTLTKSIQGILYEKEISNSQWSWNKR